MNQEITENIDPNTIGQKVKLFSYKKNLNLQKKKKKNEKGKITINEKDFTRAQAHLGKGNRKGSIVMRVKRKQKKIITFIYNEKKVESRKL